MQGKFISRVAGFSLHFDAKNHVYVMKILGDEGTYAMCSKCGKELIDEMPYFCNVLESFFCKNCIAKPNSFHQSKVLARNPKETVHYDHPVILKVISKSK